MAPRKSKKKPAPRRSKRLENLANPPFPLLELSSEIRVLIFSYMVIVERPFMIGRVQEDRGHTNGSPRDIFTIHKNPPHKVRRDDSRNRPEQPPISRVCRAFRKESLPLWYARNQFWLIHNEFERLDDNTYRRFRPWISQTPREMFDRMESVSLCGYTDWPNRVIITLDLKNRRVVKGHCYSTYGQENPWSDRWDDEPSFLDTVKKTLAENRDADGLAALEAVLALCDCIYQIPGEYFNGPPGMQRLEPAAGWEYDF
ncbi:hypothetical protein DL98DRAFT_589836 [Cadophora sp. DSE1049]|nr:hypothetical protein DL98DRAFT_589836 [Cadophora sp. DSE1049]